MMPLKNDSYPIATVDDVGRVRQIARERASDLKFSLVDQTKLVTAASELARNTLEHGGGGSMSVDMIVNGNRKGIRLTFSDRGPGIPNLELAFRDGYSTGTGLGLGLGGSRRLVNEFNIQSEVGLGTTVSIIRWK